MTGSARGFIPWDLGCPAEPRAQRGSIGLLRGAVSVAPSSVSPGLGDGRTLLRSPSASPRPRCAHGGHGHPLRSQPSERRRGSQAGKGILYFCSSTCPLPGVSGASPAPTRGTAVSPTHPVPARPTVRGATAAPWGGHRGRPQHHGDPGDKSPVKLLWGACAGSNGVVMN